MKFFLILLPIFSTGWFQLHAQSLTPQVINAAGGGGAIGNSGVEVYYNIGEAFYTTLNNGNTAITQGFLQPDVAGEFGLRASAYMTPASCADKADGSIKIEARLLGVADPSRFQISYYWNSAALCPSGEHCPAISQLAAGTYSVLVVAKYTGSGNTLPNDTVKLTGLVVNGSAEPCQITIYNGFTPNGDGINDVFYIENIAQFPDNSVEIFNRWGQKLAGIKHYDNVEQVWAGTMGSSNQKAPDGTYFYIIDLGNGTAPLKGWIELTNSR